MKINSIFKRRAPTNATNGSAFNFVFGQSNAGKRVTERTAMQTTAVYACVRIIAESVASLPLHLYKYTGDNRKEKALKHPLYSLLHNEPNAEMTSFSFFETMLTHLLLWGNAYAQIIKNGKGDVIALYPLMANRMRVDRDDNKNIYYEYMITSDDASKDSGMVKLKEDEVLHIVGLGFDGLIGYSPIAMARNSIGLSIATEEYGSKFFSNGAYPSAVLEHPSIVKDPSKVREHGIRSLVVRQILIKLQYWKKV